MPRRDGFTIVEVLVALIVGSIVLLGAEHVLGILADSAQTIIVRSVDADGDANGERVLRTLVGRIEVGAPGASAFLGDQNTVRFSSWCDMPTGWLERCAVTLSFDSRAEQQLLVADIDRQRPLVLMRGGSGGAFRYLESAAHGGQWFQRWDTGITAPLGIGVLLDRGARTDTLLLRIGPRG
jgi:prepilin-type N-terminal cleavage/methylation domain-containing protein